MDADDGKEIKLDYKTISLDNCGNIDKYINNNEDNADLKKTSITDFNFFSVFRRMDYIPKEKLDNQCVLMDGKLPHFLKGV